LRARLAGVAGSLLMPWRSSPLPDDGPVAATGRSCLSCWASLAAGQCGSPPSIGGHIPDVAAYCGGTLQIVAEAETCDTLSDADTEAQWKASSRSGYRFDVIVPRVCLQSARAQASIWGVTVDNWWRLDI
jgi:hypothetical protein